MLNLELWASLASQLGPGTHSCHTHPRLLGGRDTNCDPQACAASISPAE